MEFLGFCIFIMGIGKKNTFHKFLAQIVRLKINNFLEWVRGSGGEQRWERDKENTHAVKKTAKKRDLLRPTI